MTFEECLNYPKRSGKLDHNTFLVRRDADTFAVVLYSTAVVLIHRDGTYTLDNGGWPTPTTKDRINRFSPARVAQEKKRWVLWWRNHEDGSDNGAQVEFSNGMKVDGKGRPVFLQEKLGSSG
jgi:hypothetical protein